MSERRLGLDAFKKKCLQVVQQKVVPHLKNIKNCAVSGTKAYLKGQASKLMGKFCSVGALKTIAMKMVLGKGRRLWGFNPKKLLKKAVAVAKKLGCVTFKGKIISFCKSNASKYCKKGTSWAVKKLG